MSTKRLFSLILAVAMLVAIVAGCTNQNGAPISSPPAEETAAPVQSEQPTQSEEPQQVSATGKGTLTFARTESIATLNPHMYTSDIESCCSEYTGAALYGYFYNDDKSGVSLRAGQTEKPLQLTILCILSKCCSTLSWLMAAAAHSRRTI